MKIWQVSRSIKHKTQRPDESKNVLDPSPQDVLEHSLSQIYNNKGFTRFHTQISDFFITVQNIS